MVLLNIVKYWYKFLSDPFLFNSKLILGYFTNVLSVHLLIGLQYLLEIRWSVEYTLKTLSLEGYLSLCYVIAEKSWYSIYSQFTSTGK